MISSTDCEYGRVRGNRCWLRLKYLSLQLARLEHGLATISWASRSYARIEGIFRNVKRRRNEKNYTIRWDNPKK